MEYRVRMRMLCVLLVAALTLFAPIGRFGNDGIAHANLSPNGWIKLDDSYIYGDEIRVYWSLTNTQNFHVQEPALYRLPDETKLTLESSELTIMYNAGVLVKSLEPGSYRLEIKLVQGGDVLDTYIHEFDMPYPVTRLVHVFGTEEPIEGLVFRQTFPESEEPLTATEIPNPGKGYVTYAVDIIPDRCFTMESDNYDFSVGNKLCASESREFIVHASDATDYSVRLSLFYAFIDEEEGILSGYLLPNMNGMYMLTMDLYDQNENAHACYMNGEIEYMFECELPDEPDYLWIDMKIGGMVVPANIVIPLTDINLPGEMTIVDEKEHLDLIDPLIEFEDVADENEFAFYKITPTQEDFLPTGMRYIPVGGESNSIDLDLIEAVGFNDRNVAIQLVDTDGNLHAKTAVFPLIDKMSKQEGRVDYETKYDMKWIESDSPEDASFRDDDLTAGDRSGKVTWSLPEIGEIDLIAYDLYFYSDTDPDQVKIQGEARVYVIQGLTQTFEYQLENVPEWADYLEVVPLLRDMVQRRDHYGSSFFIPLNDRGAPLLDELRVDGNPVFPKESGSTYYEYIAAWNADHVDVTATSTNGVVYIGDEEPAQSITATVYLNEPVTSVPIRVKTPEGDWSSEYELVITKEPAPDAPKLTSLIVDGQEIVPVGSLYSVTVGHEVSAVTVTASANADVEIELSGVSQKGSVQTVIPITDDTMSLTIHLYDSVTELVSEYVLNIVREVPDNLVLDVLGGWFHAGDDEYVYSGVPRGMTVDQLRERFVLVSDTEMSVRNRDGLSVSDDHIVQSGYTIELIRGPKTQTIRIDMLADRLRSFLGLSSGSPITLVHIVTSWIHHPEDLDGDGKIDANDARLLLNELN